MALASDSSTPAYLGTTTSVTSQPTTSFTPPLGALLVACFANANTTTFQTVPTNTGGAVTWAGAAQITESGNGAASSIWLGTVTTSASMTVTGHLAVAKIDWAFGVV